MDWTLHFNDIDHDLRESASGYFVEISAVIEVKISLLVGISRDGVSELWRLRAPIETVTTRRGSHPRRLWSVGRDSYDEIILKRLLDLTKLCVRILEPVCAPDTMDSPAPILQDRLPEPIPDPLQNVRSDM